MRFGGRGGSSMTIKVDSLENQQQLEVVVNGLLWFRRYHCLTAT